MAKDDISLKVEKLGHHWIIKGHTKPHTQLLLDAGANWDAKGIRWVYDGDVLPQSIRDAINGVNKLDETPAAVPPKRVSPQSSSPKGEKKQAGQGKPKSKTEQWGEDVRAAESAAREVLAQGDPDALDKLAEAVEVGHQRPTPKPGDWIRLKETGQAYEICDIYPGLVRVIDTRNVWGQGTRWTTWKFHEVELIEKQPLTFPKLEVGIWVIVTATGEIRQISKLTPLTIINPSDPKETPRQLYTREIEPCPQKPDTPETKFTVEQPVEYTDWVYNRETHEAGWKQVPAIVVKLGPKRIKIRFHSASEGKVIERFVEPTNLRLCEETEAHKALRTEPEITPKPADESPLSQFKHGSLVKHPEYGLGLFYDVESAGTKARVMYGNGKVSLKVDQLTPVGGVDESLTIYQHNILATLYRYLMPQWKVADGPGQVGSKRDIIFLCEKGYLKVVTVLEADDSYRLTPDGCKAIGQEAPDRLLKAIEEEEAKAAEAVEELREWKVGDVVTVVGSDIEGTIIEIGTPSRHEGKLCVRRPNPKGGSQMTHWVKREKVKFVREAEEYSIGAGATAMLEVYGPEEPNRSHVSCLCGWHGTYDDPSEATLALGIHLVNCGKDAEQLRSLDLTHEQMVDVATAKIEADTNGFILEEAAEELLMDAFDEIEISEHVMQALIVRSELVKILHNFGEGFGKKITLTIVKATGWIVFSEYSETLEERATASINAIVTLNAHSDTLTLQTSLYALLSAAESVSDDVVKLTYKGVGTGLLVDGRATNGVHTLWCKEPVIA